MTVLGVEVVRYVVPAFGGVTKRLWIFVFNCVHVISKLVLIHGYN
jgi:hypothetical protein